MKNKVLTNTYLSMFCMEMHMMLQAGVPPGEGVLMLQDDERDEAGKAVLQSLLDELDKGELFSVALRGAGVFPQYMTGMVENGEKTGRLAETMKALSEYYDRQERRLTAIKNAVLYPSILLVMMLGVVFILITRVLPVYNEMFGRLGVMMSPLAVQLMRFGRWMGGASAVIAVVSGVIFIAALALWALPGLRAKAAAAFKHTPGMLGMRGGNRGVFASMASSRFVGAMALSMASGLDAEEAVEMASAVSGGTEAADKNNALCAEMLKSGKALPEAMRDAGIISAREGRLLALGIRSGMGDSAMSEIARRKERDAEDGMDRLIGRIEPAMVITASAVVGVILLSVMLPLIGIMTSI